MALGVIPAVLAYHAEVFFFVKLRQRPERSHTHPAGGTSRGRNIAAAPAPSSLPPPEAAISTSGLQGKPSPVSKLVVSLFILP